MFDFVLSSKEDEADTWFVDSGASIHMTGNRQWFENFKETSGGANIYLGDDRGYQIKDVNLKVELYKSYCVIKDLLDSMKPIASGTCVGGLYKLNVKSAPHQALASSTMTTVDLWHQRFGHINFNDLLLLQKRGMVEGLPVLKPVYIDCDACALGKLHRDKFPMKC
eukprot:PITA_35887